jgi:hypothetical protein
MQFQFYKKDIEQISQSTSGAGNSPKLKHSSNYYNVRAFIFIHSPDRGVKRVTSWGSTTSFRRRFARSSVPAPVHLCT